MTIGIVTITFPALSETFISNKVIRLAAKGHTVVVFCNGINRPLLNKLFNNVANVSVVAFTKQRLMQYIATHPQALAGRGAASLAETVTTKARLHYINKYKPDIVHIEFSGLGILYLPVLNKLSPKKIVSCRGSAEKVKLLVSDERKESTKQLFDAVDAIHCVSGDMKETIAPYCSDVSKIFINYPSIDATLFNRQRPYSHKPATILSIGRFTFQKGYLTGLLAIKKLKKDFTDFTWVIIGDGPQKDEILFHIHAMGLEGHVRLAGAKNRDEVLEAYNSSTIFFLPSVYEGIANVVLEAMSMQLPVVATKSGGMQEVITHGDNGMLADVYDADALAACLLTLLLDDAKCKQIGLLARERVLEQFTIEKQAGIFEETYKKLLGAG